MLDAIDGARLRIGLHADFDAAREHNDLIRMVDVLRPSVRKVNP
jgi:hypothetical protein